MDRRDFVPVWAEGSDGGFGWGSFGLGLLVGAFLLGRKGGKESSGCGCLSTFFLLAVVGTCCLCIGISDSNVSPRPATPTTPRVTDGPARSVSPTAPRQNPNGETTVLQDINIVAGVRLILHELIVCWDRRPDLHGARPLLVDPPILMTVLAVDSKRGHLEVSISRGAGDQFHAWVDANRLNDRVMGVLAPDESVEDYFRSLRD